MQIITEGDWWMKLESARTLFKDDPNLKYVILVHNGDPIKVTPQELKDKVIDSIQLPEGNPQEIACISYRKSYDDDPEMIEAGEDTVIESTEYPSSGYIVTRYQAPHFVECFIDQALVLYTRKYRKPASIS